MRMVENGLLGRFAQQTARARREVPSELCPLKESVALIRVNALDLHPSYSASLRQ